jgi:hypothetical protein
MKKLLLILVLVFLLSGCVEQPVNVEKKVNDGIMIKDFSFDSSTVYENDNIGLNFEVQNVGEYAGTLQRIIIFGGWPDIDYDDSPNKVLVPSDSNTGFEGEGYSFRNKYPAPEVDSKIGYTVGTRIIYSYQTTYSGTLRIMTDRYLETLPENERNGLINSGGIVSSSVTGGPLVVRPMQSKSFIIYDNSESVSSTIVFEVDNVGSGFPNDGITVNEESMYIVSIDDQYGIDDCNLDESTDIKLSKGKKRLFSCSFDKSGITSKEDILFSITLGYNYYVDRSTSITVLPMPEI